MNIVITGGAGFLGQRLCTALLQRGTLTDAQGHPRPIQRIRLFDVVLPPAAQPASPPPSASAALPAVSAMVGDINIPQDLQRALGEGAQAADTVFHLAAVVSGEAEQNFDLGMRVNLDGTRALLEACRKLPRAPKVIFTSSLAVFGGPLPDPVPDAWPVFPQNSYGAQKAMGELLINDMSRKGFIDGRVLRLPTITVRPGKPNKAASGFMSGIIREPLNGIESVCPVSPELRVWVLSPRRAIENLIIAHEAPTAGFAHTRTINVPGLSVAVGDMVAALRTVAGDDVATRVKWQRDSQIEKIVAGWPAACEATLGHALGMQPERDFASMIRAYMEDSQDALAGSKHTSTS